MTDISGGLGDGYPDGNPRHEDLHTEKQHIEWCRRRALYHLNRNEFGCLGIALGGLAADLSRYAGMDDLLDKVRALPSNREVILQFVEYM